MTGLIMPWAAGMLRGKQAGFDFIGMAVDLNAQGTGGESSTGSLDLNSLFNGSGSAVAVDDLVLVLGSHRSGSDSNITCSTSGYTELFDIYANGTNADANLAAYWHVHAGGSSTTVTVNYPSTDTNISMALVFRGVDTGTPFDATQTTATAVSGNPDPPSITTVTNNARVVVAGCAVSPTSLTNTDMDYFYMIGNALYLGIGYIDRPTAGAFNPAAYGSTGTVFASCAATFALRPA